MLVPCSQVSYGPGNQTHGPFTTFISDVSSSWTIQYSVPLSLTPDRTMPSSRGPGIQTRGPRSARFAPDCLSVTNTYCMLVRKTPLPFSSTCSYGPRKRSLGPCSTLNDMSIMFLILAYSKVASVSALRTVDDLNGFTKVKPGPFTTVTLVICWTRNCSSMRRIRIGKSSARKKDNRAKMNTKGSCNTISTCAAREAGRLTAARLARGASPPIRRARIAPKSDFQAGARPCAEEPAATASPPVGLGRTARAPASLVTMPPACIAPCGRVLMTVASRDAGRACSASPAAAEAVERPQATSASEMAARSRTAHAPASAEAFQRRGRAQVTQASAARLFFCMHSLHVQVTLIAAHVPRAARATGQTAMSRCTCEA
mmetsp:Transcript_11527/g.30823  ORF Transcript_11527/g.30823 Transcript_11527/m.30823 type:complete len:372 (+) Transcript_11527:568-1683(+)